MKMIAKLSFRRVDGIGRILLFAALMALQPLSAQVTNWSSLGGDFNNAANWDAGVPTTGVDANISATNGGNPFTVDLSGSTTPVMNDLSIPSADAVLSIRAIRFVDSWLTVEGNLSNNGTVLLTGDGFSGEHSRIYVEGLFTNTGLFSLVNTNHTPHFYGNLTNNGTVSVEDAASYISRNGETGTFTNNNAFNVTSGAVLHIDGAEETFVQAGGTLDNQGTIVFTNAAFEFDGGDITGNAIQFFNSTRLRLNHTGTGSFTFYRSTHTLEGDVELGQTLLIYANRFNDSYLTSADSFRNSGTITLSGDGFSGETSRLTLNSGTLTNDGVVNFENTNHTPRFYGDLLNNGTFNIHDGQSYFNAVGGSGLYTNNGLFTIHETGQLDITESGATFVQSGGTLANVGVFDITEGVFEYRGGAISGNPIRFWENADLILDHDGDGSFVFYRSTNTLAGDVAAAQDLHIYASRFQDSILTSADSFVNEGSILFSGDGFSGEFMRIYLSTGTLTNNGSITWSSSTHTPDLYGNLINNGTFDIYDDQAYFRKVDSTGVFENRAELTIHTGADLDIAASGEVFLQTDGTLANDGRFDITNGTFTYNGGNITGNPIFFWAGTSLNLNHDGSGSFNFYRSNHLLTGNIAASQEVLLYASRFQDSILTSADSFVNDGTILFSGDEFSGEFMRIYLSTGTLTNNGSITWSSSTHTPDLYGNLINNGTFDIYDDQAYFRKVGSTGVFENRAELTIHTGADLDIAAAGEVFLQTDGTLANDGRFDITNGTFTYNGGNITGNPIFFWAGTSLNLNHGGSGSFNFYRSNHLLTGNIAASQEVLLYASRFQDAIVTQNADFENAGTISFSGDGFSGEFARIYAPSQTIANSGTIVVNNSGHTPQIYGDLINAGTFQIDDAHTDIVGSLTNSAGGVLQGVGFLDMNGASVINNGRLSPGSSVGALTINNDVENGATAELYIEIDSSGADLMTVQGSYNLAGDLLVDFLDGFTPEETATFTILTSNLLTGVVGDFNNVENDGEIVVPGGFMRLSVSDNSLILSGFSSQAEPDPSSSVDFFQRFDSTGTFRFVEIVDNEQSATVSGERVLISGNPREFWRVTHGFGPANLFSTAELAVLNYDETHTWNPDYEGAITSVDLTLDVQLIDDPDGLGVRIAPAVVQSGVVFTGTAQELTTLSVWSAFSFSSLASTDFSYQGSHPDFSATGAPLTFGFYVISETSGASESSLVIGFDNLFISINEISPSPSLGVGSIMPLSYDMQNGQSGAFQYYDRTYSGSGNNASTAAQLSDGTGQLTDGFIGSGNIVANFGNGAAYEWVGWSSVTPVITFDFGSIKDFSLLRFFLGRDLDRASGNVGIPDRITVEFGREDAFGTVYFTDRLTYDIDETIEYAWKSAIVDVPAEYEGRFIRVTLHDGDGPWIFLSEVEFFDTAGVNYPTEIAYADFDDLSGFYLGSNTSQSLSTGFQLGNALQLNPPADSNMGGVIFHEPQEVLDGFYTKFSFVIADIENGSNGGEGLAFHLSDEVNWNSGFGAVGREGLTLQFDTYPQDGEADNSCRVYGRDGRLLAEVDLAIFSINLESGSALDVEIFHNGQFINVRVDGQWVITDVFVPSAEFASSEGKARVGFSSQTGSDHESIYLLNWYFDSGFESVATLSPDPVNFPPQYDPLMGRLDAQDGGRSPVFVSRALIEAVAATPSTVIRYTLDGTTPTTSSTEYTGPLEFIDAGQYTLKTVAFGNGLGDSPVATVQFEVLSDGRGRVVREKYVHQWGTSLDVLKGDPVFARQIPASIELLETPEIPVNSGDYYGTRLMGYVEAPVSGNYTFFIASDNEGELLLSTNEDRANSRVIATVPTSTSSRSWTTFSSQSSDPVALVAGQRYFFEARQIEGGGADNLAVGWQLPGGSYERPIPISRVFAYGSSDVIGWRPVEYSVSGGIFDAAVAVELSHPDAGASIYYTTDGSVPTESDNLYTGAAISISSDTELRARAFNGNVAVSGVAVETYRFDSEAVFTRSGLRQWYRADSGISEGALGVSRWANLVGEESESGFYQYNISQQPSWVEGIVNGHPVVRFDGTDDGLIGDATTYTENPYTIFVVYQRLGDLGRTIQSRATNWLLGLHSNPGFLAGAWVGNKAPGAGDIDVWNLAVGSRDSEAFYFLNGMNFTEAKSPSGVPQALAIGGGEGVYNEPVHADIAEILVFDRELSQLERQEVELYLSSRYELYMPVAEAPEMSLSQGSYSGSQSLSLSSKTPDASIYYTLDGSTPSTASTLYSSPISLSATATVNAIAIKSGYLDSAVSARTYRIDEASLDIPEAELLVWLDASHGLTLGADQRVISWKDLSGNGHTATTSGFTKLWRPRFAPSAVNGLPAVDFDDASLRLDTIELQAPSTVFIVYQPKSSGGYILSGSNPWRLGMSGSGADFVSSNKLVGSSAPLNLGEPNVAVALQGESESQFFFNGLDYTGDSAVTGGTGQLTLGGKLGHYKGASSAYVAELIVYERALSVSERISVEQYLAAKYSAFSPKVITPVVETPSGYSANPIEVTLSCADPLAEIRYTVDGSLPTESSTLYTGPFTLSTITELKLRAFRSGFLPSDVVSAYFEIGSTATEFATNGLQLWLSADRGLSIAEVDASTASRFITVSGDSLAMVTYDFATDDVYLNLIGAHGLPSNVTSLYALVYDHDRDVAYALGNNTDSGESTFKQYLIEFDPLTGSGTVIGLIHEGPLNDDDQFFEGLAYSRTEGLIGSYIPLNGGAWGRELRRIDTSDASHVPIALSSPDRDVDSLVWVEGRGLIGGESNGQVAIWQYTDLANGANMTIGSGTNLGQMAYDERQEVLFNLAGDVLYTIDLDAPSPAPVARASIPGSISGLAYLPEAQAQALNVRGIGRVSGWSDLSGNGYDATVPGFSRTPRFVLDGMGGQPAIQFDGVDDGFYVDSALSVGRPATFFIVFAKTGNVGRILQSASGANWLLGTYQNGIGFYPGGWVRNGVPLPSNTGFLATGLQTNSSSHFYINGDDLTSNSSPTGTVGQLAIGGALGTYNEPSDALISEIIVFDRDLDETERREVEAYLANKYSLYTPRVPTPIVNPPSGQYTGTVSVSMASPVIGTSIRYTTDGSDPTGASILYTGPFSLGSSTELKVRSFAPGYGPSSVVEANYVIDQDLPISENGLALWLDATRGLAIDSNGDVEMWADLSGNGHDALQTGSSFRPEVASDSGRRIVHFASSNDGMKIDSALNIDEDYTVFAVYRRTGPALANNNALVQGVGAPWFVGPYWNSHGFYNGSNWVSPNNTTPTENVWYVSSARRSEGTSSYHLNGEDRTDNRYTLQSPGNLALGFEGIRGGVQNYDLAEVIAYNRGLTEAERLEVENYLAAKWSLTMVPEPPVFSPRPGHYNEPVDLVLTPAIEDSTIRYTLDGSTPDINSTLYTGPISLVDDTVVNALEVTSGGVLSPVRTASYLISASETGHVYVEYFGGISSTAISAFAATPDYPERPQSYELLGSLATPVDRGSDFSSWVRGYIHPPQTGEYSFAVSSDNSGEFYLSTDDDPANIQLLAYLNGFASPGDYGSSISQNQPVTLEAGRRYYFEARAVETFGGDHISIQWELPDTTVQGPIPGLYLSPYGLTDEPSKLVPVTISPVGAVYSDSVSVALTHPKPGVEVRYTLDGSEPTESSLLYSTPLLVSSATTVKAKAFRTDFTESQTSETRYDFDSATQFTRDGLHMWYRADLGVMESAGAVSDWLNLANFDTSAEQSDSGQQPELVTNGFNGEPVIRFDGSDDRLDFVSTPLSEFTVALVYSANSTNGWGGPLSYGANGVSGFHLVNNINSTASYQSELVTYPGEATRAYASELISLPFGPKLMVWDSIPGQSLDGLDLEILNNGTGGWGIPTSSIGFSYSYLAGDIAEILIFDRVLSSQERGELELYLANRYAQTLILDEPTVMPGGGLYESQIEVSFNHAGPNVELRYTLDGTDPIASSALYSGSFFVSSDTTVKVAAFRLGATTSEVVTTEYLFDSDTRFSRDGLALWLRPDTGAQLNGQGVQVLSDLSGNGMDAMQSIAGAQPLLAASSINGEPALRFDGNDDFLQMPSGFSDFSAGMTLFVVAKTQSANSDSRFIDLGNGQASNNIVLARESTGDNFNYLSYSGASLQGSVKAVDGISPGVPTIYGVVHDVSSVATILKNGVGQATSVFNLPPYVDRTSNYIGRSNWSNHGYFSGDIAEVMLFDRALSFVEREEISEYLRDRYGIASQTVERPSFSQNPGFFAGSVDVAITTITPNTRLYYTVDGSIPDETDTLYSGPVTLTESTELNVRGFRAGFNPSPIRSGFFIVGDPPSDGDGLAVVYYDNSDFTGTSVRSLDPTINSNWGIGSPDSLIGPDTFSAIWEGQVQAQFSETYTFIVESDGGCRLTVDGNVVIDHMIDGNHRRTAEVALVKGQKYDLRLEYFENTGSARVRLLWSSFSETEKVIPSTQLSSGLLYANTVRTPRATPASGTYPTQVSVSLHTGTPNAIIYYTMDGSEPTTSSSVYAGSVLLTSDASLKAMAVAPGFNPSGTIIRDYVVDNSGPVLSNPLFNNSPLVDAMPVNDSGTIEVTATDSGSVSRVEFFVEDAPGGNSVLLNSDTYGVDGYTAQWDADLTPVDGSYQIRIVAYDSFNTASELVINVNLQLDPPAAPVIATPASGIIVASTLITVSGTAERNTTLVPFVNNVAGANRELIGANGHFSIPVTLQPGVNSVAVRARNRAGESAQSNVLLIEIDNTLPDAPPGFKAESRLGGRVRLTWLEPASSNTSHYRIYRSTAPFTDVADATRIVNRIENVIYDDVPSADGVYYYGIETVNAAGSVSLLSPVLEAVSDRSGPEASAVVLTHADSGLQDGARLGVGTVELIVTVNEPLIATPFLSVNPNGSASTVVPLIQIGDSQSYRGSFGITSETADGSATITFSGRDIYGNAGSTIQSGGSWYFDTAGPVVTSFEVIQPELPILNNSSEEVSVSLILSEAPEDVPTLTYYMSEGLDTTPVPLTLAPGSEANEWGATFNLPADAGILPDDYAVFEFEATDRFGNTGDAIEGDNAFLVYQGTLPGLSPSLNFYGVARPGGEVELNWLSVDNASGYRIYRSAEGQTELTTLVDINSGETLSYVDAPPTDGIFRYAIATLRSANSQVSEGDSSAPVAVTVDGTPPLPPSNLALQLTSLGMAATWDRSPSEGTESITYSLYRGADVPIASVVGQSLLAADLTVDAVTDPSPVNSEPSYVVVAVDSVGNLSPISNSAFNNVGLLPVQNLKIFRKEGFQPFISWAAAGISVNGYELVREGQVLSTTTSTGYSDESYDGAAATYGVTVIDTNDARSLTRELALPETTFLRTSTEPVRRGLMNRVYYTVTNSGDTPIENAVLKVKLAGRSHQSTNFSVPAFSAQQVSLVLGGYPELSGNSAQVTESLEIRPNSGELVELEQTRSVEVSSGGITATVLGSEFRRGTNAKASFTLYNPADELIEVILARGGGSRASDQVRFRLLDGATVLASVPVEVNTGQGIVALSNGAVVLRLPAKATYVSPDFDLPIPLNAPREAQLQLEIDQVHSSFGKAEQVSLSGTEAITDVVITDVDYRATITNVTPENAKGGEMITISGETRSTSNDALLPSLPLTVVILHEGFERTYELTSDVNGRFSFEFEPLDNEAGRYSAWARHTDISDRSIQATFFIERLGISPSIYNLRQSRGVPFDIPISVIAADGTNATNLRAVYEASFQQPSPILPGGIEITPAAAVTVNGGGRANLSLGFVGNADADKSGSIRVKLISDERPTDGWGYVTVNYTLTEGKPALAVSRSSFNQGANPGETIRLSVDLRNNGVVVAQDVQLALLENNSGTIVPAPDWLSLDKPAALGNLDVGASEQIGINLALAEDFPIGIYQYGLRIRSTNNPEILVPISLTVTNDVTGGVAFKVLDIYTGEPDPDYVAPGSPEHPTPNFSGVRNVRIRLQNEIVTTQIFSGVTDGLGEYLFQDIPAGRYRFRLNSDSHGEVAGRVTVQPGTIITQTSQMQNRRVIVEWEVVPITIEDRYEILLTATFETEVPAPVVVVTPVGINFPPMCPGDVYNGEITIANYGLIRADNFVLPTPPADDTYYYELLDAVPDTIGAGEVYVVPFRVTCLQALQGNCEEAVALAGGQPQSSGGCSYRICSPYNYDYECDNGLAFSDGGQICWTGSGRGCGDGGSGRYYYHYWGDGVSTGGGYGNEGGGGAWSPPSIPLPNQPPDCECDPDPCCEEKGK